MKKSQFFVRTIIVVSLIVSLLAGQTRQEISVPDIPGYQTLIGDFHMHTLYSDGNVWPTTRVEEAYRDGLDVIAITEHVEYKAYADYVPPKHGLAYEIAQPRAEELGIILIKGAEITRSMPPGHLNALFIKEIKPLTNDDPMKAIEIAANQGAYIFWNHPGWSAQLKEDGVVRWYDEHTDLYEKGYLKGIEIVNEKEYYPKVFQWALDKNLTLLGNSDVHSPINYLYDQRKGEHRPYTLVFATEKSLPAIRDAFDKRRTAVYHENKIFGRKEILTPFFEGCLETDLSFLDPHNGHVTISLGNSADLPLVLAPDTTALITVPKKVTIAPRTSERLTITIPEKYQTGRHDVNLSFKAENFYFGPIQSLTSHIKLNLLNLTNVGLETGPAGNVNFSLPTGVDDVKLRYSTTGNYPTKQSPPMSVAPTTEGKLSVWYAAFKNGTTISKVYKKNLLLHKGLGATIKLTHQPAQKYAAAGERSLIDGNVGQTDYTTGNWLGFKKDDLVADIFFNKPKSIDSITVRFLEKNNSWIFMPKEVTIEAVGIDGNSKEIFTWEKQAQGSNNPVSIIPLAVATEGKIKQLRITAKNPGNCPDWHPGAGNEAWLFVDEIVIH